MGTAALSPASTLTGLAGAVAMFEREKEAMKVATVGAHPPCGHARAHTLTRQESLSRVSEKSSSQLEAKMQTMLERMSEQRSREVRDPGRP